MVETSGKNLVFLVSAPRSGSTMLGAMLGSLPGVICPPETWVQLLLSLFEQDGGLVDAPFDHRLAVSAYCELADPEMRSEASRAFACAIYNRILAETGTTVLIDKTPRYYHLLPRLQSMWPAAQFLWIQRNPLDVIASCKDTWSISVEEQMGEVITPHTYDSTVSFDHLTGFFSESSPSKTIVRYEELVSNPETTLRTLTSRLGFSFNPDIIEYGNNGRLVSHYRGSSFGDKKALDHSAPHQGSIGRWRTVLTSEEVRTILKTLGHACFKSQGYNEEFVDACSFAGVSVSKISKSGTWAQKMRRAAGSAPTSELPSYFSATRTIKDQASQLRELQVEYEKANRQLIECYKSSDALQNQHNLLSSQLEDLRSNFDRAEADRVARITELAALYPQLESYKNERNLLGAQLADLRSNFEGAERDRQARTAELSELYPILETYKNERNLAVAQLVDLKRNFESVESDRKARGELVEKLGKQISAYEAEIDRRLGELTSLYPQLDAYKNERNLLAAQLKDLTANFESVEADRIARGNVIEQQGARNSELERLIHSLQQERNRWQAVAEQGVSKSAEKST